MTNSTLNSLHTFNILNKISLCFILFILIGCNKNEKGLYVNVEDGFAEPDLYTLNNRYLVSDFKKLFVFDLKDDSLNCFKQFEFKPQKTEDYVHKFDAISNLYAIDSDHVMVEINSYKEFDSETKIKSDSIISGQTIHPDSKLFNLNIKTFEVKPIIKPMPDYAVKMNIFETNLPQYHYILSATKPNSKQAFNKVILKNDSLKIVETLSSPDKTIGYVTLSKKLTPVTYAIDKNDNVNITIPNIYNGPFDQFDFDNVDDHFEMFKTIVLSNKIYIYQYSRKKVSTVVDIPTSLKFVSYSISNRKIHCLFKNENNQFTIHSYPLWVN